MRNVIITRKKLFIAVRVWALLLLVIAFSVVGVLNKDNNQRVEAATSSTINFQARLLTNTGALVPDGYYNAQFNLYNVSSGGSSEWSETYYDSNGVSPGNDNRVRVVNGYLSVYLGSQTALPSTINWDQEQWLGINIGGTAQTATPTWDGEMTPRLKLSASPYALTAGSLQATSGANALKLNLASPTANVTYTLQNAAAGSYNICTTATVCSGYAASSGSGSYIQNGTSVQTAANFNIDGSGTIGGTLTASGQQVIIQPTSSLTAGQTNITQTLTNASSTGGTVNGYNQTITIANSGSFSTTNGVNITLTDNASGIGNVNTGLNVTLNGSNTTQGDVGINSSVIRGIAIQGTSSGSTGTSGAAKCNNVSALGVGVCAGDTANSNSGAGLYGYTNSRGTSNIYDPQGTAVYGINQAGGTGGAIYSGVKGITTTNSAAGYTSIGVYGQAKGGAGASIYGGYFTLDSGSSATAVGSALYASNSTTTANILQLQDNTTNVFKVADGGAALFQNSANSSTAFQIQDLLGNQVFVADTSHDTIGLGSNAATSIRQYIWAGSSYVGQTIDQASGNTSDLLDLAHNGVNVVTFGATGATTIHNSTNSTTAFQIQFAGVNGNLFTADTQNGRITIGTGVVNPGAELFAQSISDTTIRGYNTNTPGVTDLLQLANATDNVFKVNNTGATTIKTTTNSSNAFQIQNSGGGNLLNVDSINSNITLLGNNSGELGTWQTASNPLPAATYDASSITANGYVYEFGGYTTSYQSSVYYAKLNSDGSVGAWQTAANSLPATRGFASSITANGYAYVIGGSSGSGAATTVYYAKLNSDGSVGAWQTANNSLPVGRNFAGTVTANGYVYVIGGTDGSTSQSTVYYAKLNSDGSVGAWQTAANALPAARNHPASIVANGYVYAIGGGASTVYYAKLNSDGSVGTWTTATNSLPASVSPNSVVANGYVYLVGNGSSTVYYSKLNSDGSVSTWSTAINSLPASRSLVTSVIANGYVYAIGGLNGSSQSTVYYASTPRVQVGGSLDLVGLQSGNLADGDTQSFGSLGGSLTAGDTNIIGTLQVQGQANFAQGVSINNQLSLNGNATLVGDVNVGNRYGNRLFSDNFESGSLSLWDQGVVGTISTNTSIVHGGKYSAFVNPSSGLGYASATIASTTTAYARAWVYVSSQTSSPAGLLNLQDTSGQSFVVSRLSPSGDLEFWDGVTNVHTDSGTVMSTGAWHLIEMQVTTGNPTGVSQVWLDGTQIVNLSSQNNGTLSLGTVKIGDSTGGRTFSAYFDDVAADTTSTGTASSLNVDDSFHVGGTATFGNSVLVQDASDNSTAFQIQNSTGANLFTANTSSQIINIGDATLAAPSGGGTLGLWNTANTLPTAVYGATSVAYNGYIYNIGGNNGTSPITNTYYAKLNGNGSVGTWTSTTALPQARVFSSSVVYNGYIYVIGGNNGTGDSATVWSAKLNADGTIGTWTTITGLPTGSGLSLASAVVNNNYLYVLAGSSGGTLQTAVYYAKFNGDGTISGWNTTRALPVAIAGAASIVNNGYIYSIDGNTSGTTCSGTSTNASYYAKLNPNGTIGAWTSTSTLVWARFGLVGVSWGGYGYVLGGNVTGGGCNTASFEEQRAQFNSDGSFASWNDSSGAYGGWSVGATAYNGYVYQLGGTTTGTNALNSVKYASVNGNQGTTSDNASLVVNGTLTAGDTNILGGLQVQGQASFLQGIISTGNIDSNSYSADGVAGLNLTCTGGNALENAVVSGGIVTGGDCIGASYVIAYLPTQQTLANGTVTTLNFTAERADTDNYHSNVTNTSRLVAPTSGMYHITGDSAWASNATGNRYLDVILNGVTVIVQDRRTNAGCCGEGSVNVDWYLNAGDYVEMRAYQDTGGNLGVGAQFSMFKVSAAGAGVISTLQQAYDTGNTITTSSGRDLQFTLADTGTDSNFIINAASGSTSKFAVQNAGIDLFSVNPDSNSIIMGSNLAVYGDATGSNGGTGSGITGDKGGGGGGAVGGVNAPSVVGGSGANGAQSVDVSGLFSVLSGLGVSTTSPGSGNTIGGTYCVPQNGGNATGFGDGGGGANWYGGNGGNGLYGGGGGGASGGSGCPSYSGGSGGQGVVVISPVGGTNVLKTSGTSYTVTAGVTNIKVWAVGAGGGGAGVPSGDSFSGGAGGAGGVTYKILSVKPGQVINYSLGTAGTGGTGAVNGNAGGNTTVTIGAFTMTANGGGGGQYNNSITGSGGSFSGGNVVSINGTLSATGNNTVFQNQTDSTTAFQIQKSNGTALLNFDTTGSGALSLAQNVNLKLGTNAAIIENGSTNLVISETNGGTYIQSHLFQIQDNYNSYANEFTVQNGGQATFQNAINSSSAFQILTAGVSGVNVFTADTTGKNIQIGSSSTDANAVTLTLDSYNNSTDPTGTNGAMYYNTSTNTFRCYENGAWKNCINGIATQVETYRGTTPNVISKGTAATILLVPIYVPGQITVNEMRIEVRTTALGAAGDVGLYNSAGTLVLNGGNSSLTTATGLKTIAPTQTGVNRIIEAGQYYMAVTWNAATGSVAGANLTTSGDIKQVGTLSAGGGLVLPGSITPASITTAVGMVYASFNN